MRNKNLNNSRPTIGFLTKELDRYHSLLWQGITKAAEERNVNLIIFVDEFANSPSINGNLQNIVYQLTDPGELDGLIIAPGVLLKHFLKQTMEQFVKPFHSIPILSISIPVMDFPAVLVDGKGAQLKIIDHLIEHHGYRKIAFIKGIQGHPEADERFAAYLESLNSHNISVNDELIYQGNFIAPSGQLAVQEFLSEKSLDIEALAAANDEMAIDAFHAIKKMGLKIPSDIAITGFDNIENSQFLSSPLTTVRNPVYNIAKKSVELILNQINGKKVPKRNYIPAYPIFRQSCGCHQESLSNQKRCQIFANLPEFSGSNQFNPNKMISLLNFPEYNHSYYETLFRSLLDALETDLKSNDNTMNFLNLFDTIINQMDFEEDNLTIWNENFTIVANSISREIKDRSVVLLAESLLDKAQILLRDTLIVKDSQRKLEEKAVLWNLRYILNAISSSITVEDIISTIESSFPDFGIQCAYITQFMDDNKDPEQNPAELLPAKSLLLSGFNELSSSSVSTKKLIFETSQIIPDEFVPNYRRYTLIAMPLLRQTQSFGFLITEFGPKIEMIYRILREQISNALSCCQLFQVVENSEIRLKNTLNELQRSEERFREMAMLLPTAIIETSLDLSIVFLNKAGLNLLSISNQKYPLHQNFSSFIHPEDLDAFKQNVIKIINGELDNLIHFRLVDQSGHEVNLVCKASHIQRNNNIEGIRWSVIDIKPLITSLYTPDPKFFEGHNLSKREMEIANLLLQGFKNKEIAETLLIAENTVKVHIHYIYSKLNVENKTGFFNLAEKYQTGRFGHSSLLFHMLSRMIKV